MKHRVEVNAFKVLIFIVIVVAGFGSAVLYLWNWLMPEIFGLPAIGFWQALGLLGLSWLLFGGPRGFFGPHGPTGGGHLRHMSPEERERFRAGMRSRWCRHEEKQEQPTASPPDPAPYSEFA